MADPDFGACARHGATALQRWYNTSTGLWNSTGWWNSANALSAVIGYTKLTGDDRHAHVIGTTFTAAQRTHARFINPYYDDNAWWALAWIAAYDLTAESRYLTAARTIFAFNTKGWEPGTCGGGLVWNTKTAWKNAITNALFLLLAAQLHQRTAEDHGYLDWARREWDWFSASGLINPGGLVNDGLTAQGQNNSGTTWTYNSGVLLGGLAVLSEVTGDRDLLRQAGALADAAMSRLASPPTADPPGVLVEPCEPGGTCNGDQTQFKGIFVRYLYQLWQRDRRPAYRTFIVANAASIWTRNSNAAGQFGLRWTGPFDRADASRQSSALEALTAAAALTSLPVMPPDRPSPPPAARN
jgi:predicted alpha-1,6-mannanase (GH76 family)